MVVFFFRCWRILMCIELKFSLMAASEAQSSPPTAMHHRDVSMAAGALWLCFSVPQHGCGSHSSWALWLSAKLLIISWLPMAAEEISLLPLNAKKNKESVPTQMLFFCQGVAGSGEVQQQVQTIPIDGFWRVRGVGALDSDLFTCGDAFKITCMNMD